MHKTKAYDFGKVAVKSSLLTAVFGGPVALAIGAAQLYEHLKSDEKPKNPNEDIAELKARVQRLYAQLAEAMKERGAQEQFFDLMTAAYSVALAFVTEGEAVPDHLRLDIEDFLFGRGCDHLPDSRRELLRKIAAAPPNLATAIAVAKQYGRQDFPLFEDAISLTLRLKGQTATEATETVNTLFSDLRHA